MERRRQARPAVNISATLIGEKTVPKGCRVLNVSQNGMQLQCEADGRLLTFKDGDNVDLHLTIQHDGKQKKLTIPSWIRNVTADSVDVEFHRTDPLLVDLIESYRVSEQHRLEASLGRADRRKAGSRNTSPAGTAAGGERLTDPALKQAQRSPNRPYYTLILAVVFMACVITGGYVYTASIDSRISTLETMSKRQSKELADMQSRIFSASLQEGRYASLNARMTAVVDAINNLEDRLRPDGAPAVATAVPSATAAAQVGGPQTPARPPTARKPSIDEAAPEIPPATEIAVAPKPAVAPTGQGTLQKPSAARMPQETPPATDIAVAPKPTVAPTGQGTLQKPSAARMPQETSPATEYVPSTGPAAATGSPKPAVLDRLAQADRPDEDAQRAPDTEAGPWIINLLSSTDKAYVERYSRTSGAGEKYQAAVNSAMVNGRQYWRLQLTGFESLAAAKRRAETVKEDLGIDEVWFIKRK